jgi:peptidoglycan DL-endopeptidase CwlO
MTDVRIDPRAPETFALPDADRWGLTTQPPGLRDLASPEHCARSLRRSVRRRELAAARRPGLPQSATARLAAAALAATALAPAADVAWAATVATRSVEPPPQGPAGVRALQRALGVEADGVLGTATRRAVRAFQRAHGLEVDGIAGPATRAALGLGDAGTRATTRSSTRKAGAGERHARVPRALARSVQRALGVTADGSFGPDSRKALRRFQRAHGLTADGVPGPRTLAVLGVTRAGARPGGSAATDAPAAAGTGAGLSAAVAAARSKLGSPYAAGGSGPASFDCSGLTSWALRKAGIDLPRTSYAQYRTGTAVRRGGVRAGDLVFFDTDGAGASHVAIATSSATAISATTHGVMEHAIASGYWGAHYVGARRPA